MAQTIADAAMEKCKEMGFKVSVTVVDRAGLPIVMLRGDGAGLHTPEGSDRKAYTARTFRAPSADFVKRMLNDPTSVGSKEYTRVPALPGGLPTKLATTSLGPLAFRALRARTTSALKRASTRWRTSSSEPAGAIPLSNS